MARTPKYSLHKPSGQARVRIDGKDHYLGPFGSEESRQQYDSLVARWLSGRRNPDRVNVTISRLCLLYLEHAQIYYRKNGKVTSEVSTIRSALRVLIAESGRLPVNDFSPSQTEIRSRPHGRTWLGSNQH